MTKVFISWSGERSRGVAEVIKRWLPNVLQFVQPYFSPDDIEKGTKWNTEISKALSDSDVGIICLTRDNLDRQWIIFEAGALSKNFDESRVSAILFDIESSDVSGPLSSFQNTKFDKRDFKELIRMINGTGGDRSLTDATLEAVFEKWWPDLETDIAAFLSTQGETEITEVRQDRELIEETLSLVRSISRREDRPTYSGIEYLVRRESEREAREMSRVLGNMRTPTGSDLMGNPNTLGGILSLIGDSDDDRDLSSESRVEESKDKPA